MKYLYTYNELRGSERFETLFDDGELKVVVVKSYDTCKEYGEDTGWCSNDKPSFYRHNLSANMYRFVWKDGYKLRLTWDYIHRLASNDKFGGGTHWGSGGKMNIGVEEEYIPYNYIRPDDNDEPFLFDYEKGDDRQEMVDRIETISQEIIDKVHKYQEIHSLEKSNNIKKLYKDINSLKIEDVAEDGNTQSIIVSYNGTEYKARYNTEYNYFSFSKKFRKSFNNYAFYDDNKTLEIYLKDKIKEYTKSSVLQESYDIFDESDKGDTKIYYFKSPKHTYEVKITPYQGSDRRFYSIGFGVYKQLGYDTEVVVNENPYEVMDTVFSVAKKFVESLNVKHEEFIKKYDMENIVEGFIFSFKGDKVKNNQRLKLYQRTINKHFPDSKLEMKNGIYYIEIGKKIK